VESEYRALYSCFTGQKNRGSVRHALKLNTVWLADSWSKGGGSAFDVPRDYACSFCVLCVRIASLQENISTPTAFFYADGF
jgi:hypothetical protein